jgi:hypothetical protein
VKTVVVIALLISTFAVSGQKGQITTCDVIKCFLNDSVAKQFLRLDEHRLSDTLFVVDTSFQIKNCDSFFTAYNRFVILERVTDLRKEEWGGYPDQEYYKWANHIWLTFNAENGFYAVNFFWKYINGSITIKYKMQSGTLVRYEVHRGYF